MNPWLRVPVSLLGGGCAAGAVGGRAGVAVGVAAAVACWLLLRRVEPPHVRRERAAARADLPFAAELLAAALHAGAAPDRAASAVGRAMAGRGVGDRLRLIGRALRSGADPAVAWGQLADLPGGPRLARAAIRSAEHGTALARTFERQAADLRRDRAAALEARVKRAGVLVVLPVGFCFLPAFVLIGVVPVVEAVLRDVFAVL